MNEAPGGLNVMLIHRWADRRKDSELGCDGMKAGTFPDSNDFITRDPLLHKHTEHAWHGSAFKFSLIIYSIKYSLHPVRVKYAQSRGGNSKKKRLLNVVGKCTLEASNIKLLCWLRLITAGSSFLLLQTLFYPLCCDLQVAKMSPYFHTPRVQKDKSQAQLNQ